MVNGKQSIFEELRLAEHAIWTQGAREVVYNAFWGHRPARYHGREHVVAALALRDAMEAITDQVGAPRHPSVVFLHTESSTCHICLPAALRCLSCDQISNRDKWDVLVSAEDCRNFQSVKSIIRSHYC